MQYFSNVITAEATGRTSSYTPIDTCKEPGGSTPIAAYSSEGEIRASMDL